MKKSLLLIVLLISGLFINAQTLPGISYSSWIGNTFGGKNSSTGTPDAADPEDKWVQNFIDCMTVTEDGTCYTASGWDEAHREYGIYKNGDVLGNEDRSINCGEAGGFVITGTTITGNGKTITDAGIPTAIAMGRGIYDGKLLVADNGQRRQILIYDVSSTPVIVETLGVAGGIAANFTASYEFPAAINAPVYPAATYPPGRYHPLKLWGLTGVGCDSTGRIFVATSEQGSAIRCFKKVNNNWILDWRVENYFFVDNIAYDEATDAVDVYGVQEHFKLDFSKPGAGKEWSIAGYSLDAYNYPEDPRGIGEIKSGGEHMLTSVETRVINGTRYLWTHGMTCQPPVIFKFKPNSDIAVPCGMFFGRSHRIYDLPITFWWPKNRPSTDVDETLFWSDVNNDGKYQANEYSSLQNSFDGGDFYIDKTGALWQGGSSIKIWKPTFEANGNLVYKDADVEQVNINGIGYIGKLKFQEEYDRLVILTTECRDIDGGKMYIIDNWSTGNRTARYVADLKGPHQSGWTVAGDYAFEVGWETRAKVWVTDLNTGQLVGTMIPDPSSGGLDRTGWVDISSGIKAYKRTSTGEYIVFVEDDFLGRVLMYRWCLGGGCLNGGAVQGLQISAAETKIKVGDSIKLSRTFTPVNPNNINLTWSSNNEAVATVDQNGLVKGISPGVVDIKALSEDGGFSSISTITVAANFQVMHVQGGMFIDGKVDESEWEIDSLIAKPTYGVQNNKGRFNLLWDENYLYVGVTVKDAQVISSTDNDPWVNDGIEVYLDGNNNKGTVYDAFDLQIIQTASNAAVWTSRTASGISKAVVLNDSGYSMEMAIPWNALNTTVMAGSKIGFDIAYNDNDDGSRNGGTVWYGDGNNYANTAHFDDLTLLGSSSANIPVTGVKIDSSLMMLPGDTAKIEAVISPINASNKNVSWSTSNATIATVDANGLVTGIAEGIAIVTVTSVADGSIIDTCKVTVGGVTNIAPTGIAYGWLDLMGAENDDTKVVYPGLNDNITTTDVVYPDASADGNWQAAGIVWNNLQNNITSVRFYNGICNQLAENGVFSENIKIQSTVNGTTWTDISGWACLPVYPYSAAASNKIYTFSGNAISNVMGIRVIGKVRTNDSWSIKVKELKVLASISGTLPVHLIYFNVKLENGKPNLKWKTESEINVSHFDIERSNDGNQFTKIKEIASKGSNGIYNLVDEVPLNGYNYYRLKMVDKDGKFSYSNVEVVKNLNDRAFSFSMYPNPNKGLLTIAPSQTDSPVNITIFDQQGKMVLVKQITGKTSFSISHLAKGVYTVRLSNNETFKTGKLIKE